MIYLDNAATTLKKPECVRKAVYEAMGTLGNYGRGGHGIDRRTSPKARSTQSIRNVSRSRESKTLSSSSTKSPMKEDTNRARPNSYTT